MIPVGRRRGPVAVDRDVGDPSGIGWPAAGSLRRRGHLCRRRTGCL